MSRCRRCRGGIAAETGYLDRLDEGGIYHDPKRESAPATMWLGFLLTADSLGAAQLTWNVPALASLVNTSVWFQGLGSVSSPLQLSPLAGGQIR